jgi:hypothetical protein
MCCPSWHRGTGTRHSRRGPPEAPAREAEASFQAGHAGQPEHPLQMAGRPRFELRSGWLGAPDQVDLDRLGAVSRIVIAVAHQLKPALERRRCRQVGPCGGLGRIHVRPRVGTERDKRVVQVPHHHGPPRQRGPIGPAPRSRLPTRQVVIVDGPHPPVELMTAATTPKRGWSSPAVPVAPASSGLLGPHRGHIRATNDRIAADNNGHLRSRFRPAHQPHSARQRRSP